MDIRNWKFPEIEEGKIVGYEHKNKVNDPESLHTKVLDNPRHKIITQDSNKFFGSAPGDTIRPISGMSPFKRIKQQKKLNMFGDKDGDKIPNLVDKDPYKKNVKGFNRKIKSFKNII